MSASDIAEAVLGSFDGAVCVLGVIITAVISGHGNAVAVAGIGLAISEGVSMAGAAYLAGHGKKKTAIMGAAAFTSILVPVIPFILGVSWSLGWSLLISAGICVAIANMTVQSSRWISHVRTFSVVSIAVALTIIAGFFLK